MNITFSPEVQYGAVRLTLGVHRSYPIPCTARLAIPRTSLARYLPRPARKALSAGLLEQVADIDNNRAEFKTPPDSQHLKDPFGRTWLPIHYSPHGNFQD